MNVRCFCNGQRFDLFSITVSPRFKLIKDYICTRVSFSDYILSTGVCNLPGSLFLALVTFIVTNSWQINNDINIDNVINFSHVQVGRTN